MPLKKGIKNIRSRPVMVRLNALEKSRLERSARASALSMEQYIRCKLFDIPFEAAGGRPPKAGSIK